jgi:peptidoglycan hydrolase CwlO-like protein
MKKNMKIGLALAMGVLSIGAVSASASDSCGKCADKQSVQQFTQDTSALSTELTTKEIELRELYGYEGIDTLKVEKLEAELKELKSRINATAQKYGISACSRS